MTEWRRNGLPHRFVPAQGSTGVQIRRFCSLWLARHAATYPGGELQLLAGSDCTWAAHAVGVCRGFPLAEVRFSKLSLRLGNSHFGTFHRVTEVSAACRSPDI